MVKKMKIKRNLNLFYIFFKIGLFTFGGGYAMISQIREMLIVKKNMITEDELTQIIAIAESTPGPLAINMATYIGYKQNKILGSLFATIGVILPSFIIIYILSFFIDEFLQFEIVEKAFYGINAGVAFLILKTAITMFKQLDKNYFSIIIFIVCFLLMIIFEIFTINFSSLYFIIIGGILGLFINAIAKIRGDKQ